jgi:galactokinase/mevalonate kinase-like predicted kinase
MTAEATFFPFDRVVLTFPDQRAADAAASSTLPQFVRESYRNVTLVTACDPLGTRVGSGGGTLNALDVVFSASRDSDAHTNLVDDEACSILVIHAGGESSRCPTQMILGKAWTSLPTMSSVGSPGVATCRLQTPVHVWLRICERLFRGIPNGSIVVLAADTLLRLPDSKFAIDWEAHADTVFGLAVPAPLATASNHGVFVLPPIRTNAVPGASDQSSEPVIQVEPCHDVLQKPSQSTLQAHCQFKQNGQACAWIDTGVIVFLPTTATILRRLAFDDELLSRCTASTLQSMQNRHLADGDSPESALIKAQDASFRFDLYTDLLQALPMVASMDDRLDNGKVTQGPSYAVLRESFRSCRLSVMTIPSGRFLHLGTTRELLDFYTHGCHSNTEPLTASMSPPQALCREFGTSLALTRRLEAFTLVGPYGQIDPSAIIMHSSIQDRCVVQPPYSRIGAGTVIEHCRLESDSIHVGHNCILSSLSMESVGSLPMVIPDNTIVQQVRRVPQDEADTCACTLVVLGVDDKIKSLDGLYGRPLQDFMSWAGLSESDLWDEEADHKMVWNARLHPSIKPGDSYADLFSWLQLFLDEEPFSESAMRLWKQQHRYSLAEIRNKADAKGEFEFRRALVEETIPQQRACFLDQVQQTLQGRKHDCLDFQFAVDSFQIARNSYELEVVFQGLDTVLRDSLRERHFDIVARTANTFSTLLSNLIISNDTPVDNELLGLLLDFEVHVAREDNVKATQIVDELLKKRDDILKHNSVCGGYTMVMDRIAQIMTQACVCHRRYLENVLLQPRQPPIFDRWATATAPARVDLAGGWSDTPPICVENGGSVTGIAVVVNGQLPLSCQARVVRGGQGILLMAESRDTSNVLLSTVQCEAQTIADLQSYQDPTSDCALLKCALVCMGFLSSDDLASDNDCDLQPLINIFCRSESNVRLEIVAMSLLPHGSGMGTSSILGGCILSAIGHVVGIRFETTTLVDAVLVLEQRLTTGGGFQDQVNGLFGGAKQVTCPPAIPLALSVQPIPLSDAMRVKLNQRLILVFTGKTRLAKNILQTVLRRWALRTPEIYSNSQALVETSNQAREALQSEDEVALGRCLSEYWEQKKIMAGPDSGVEPLVVDEILRILQSKHAIDGGSLCGAGGGGFLILLAAHGWDKHGLEALLQDADQPGVTFNDLQWYDCHVCENGIQTTVSDS